MRNKSHLKLRNRFTWTALLECSFLLSRFRRLSIPIVAVKCRLLFTNDEVKKILFVVCIYLRCVMFSCNMFFYVGKKSICES